MYIGESKCKQCDEPIKAKWYNEKMSYDIGGHKLKEMALLVDGILKLKYECKKCEVPNELKLEYVE